MANLEDKTLRKIIREETRQIVREETRQIVREETVDMRADIKIIKEVQGSQSQQLRTLQADMGSLKNSYRGQQREMHRLGVLFEDLDNRFAAVAEVQ